MALWGRSLDDGKNMRRSFWRFGSALLLGAIFFFALANGLVYGRFSCLLAGSICLGLFVLKCLNYWADRGDGKFCSFIHWIHASIFEAFGIMIVWCLRPIGYLWKLEMRCGKGQPILLVHGYLHDSSAWIYLKRQLKLDGFGPIYMLNLKHPFLPIAEYAKQVERRAIQIELETGRSDLVLIGHSMGGLVSSLYATEVAPKGKVTDVITIGSPLAGTYVAKIALGPDGRQMERGSEFLKHLRNSILSSRGIRFYHMGTKTDELVIPYTSAFIEEKGAKQFMVNDIGHVSLLYSPRVAEKLIAWLKDRNIK